MKPNLPIVTAGFLLVLALMPPGNALPRAFDDQPGLEQTQHQSFQHEMSAGPGHQSCKLIRNCSSDLYVGLGC